jgi:non-ribosomal peptide synthetase component F
MQPHRNIIHNARRLSVGLELTPDDRTVLLGSLSGGQGLATLWTSLLSGSAIYPFPVMVRGIAGLAQWLEDRGITVWVSAASLFRHFCQALDPQASIPTIRAVRLGSEPATDGDVAAWRRHFAPGGFLMHTYSSSETGNVSQYRLTWDPPDRDGRLPVGTAVDGMELLLVDEDGNEIRAAGAGEIVVRSRYLSPGYWGQDALTAERFQVCEKAAETRMFQTGDLARRNEDGELIVVGRVDDRVKVRGYRIELGAIEQAVSLIRGVDSVAVRVRSGNSENASIVAYIIRKSGETCSAQSLRLALLKSLPQHMIPSAFVFVEGFPLTPHGKIDGRKLDSLDPWSDERASVVPPATDTERMLASAWESVFRCGAVGRDADFFELGGDSLLAAVVAARVFSSTGTEIDLRFFSDHPRLTEFASALDLLIGRNQKPPVPELQRVSREFPLPLSFGQERIWRFSQTPEQSASYTVACSYRLVGPLDVELFRRCFNVAAERHEILRTTFEQVNGNPVQRVNPWTPLEVPFIDCSDHPDAMERVAELLQLEMKNPFDLGRLPLLRVMLVRINSVEHRLFRINHHIISDAWSWRVFFDQVAAVYGAESSGGTPPPTDGTQLQYADYASWQRQRLDREALSYRESLQWWKSQLVGPSPALELPLRASHGVRVVKPEDGVIWWGLDPSVSRRLEAVARARGATYFMIRLAAFAVQLAWETESEDFVVGTYATNRTRLETQRMFGFFANLTTLRFRLTRGRPFTHWLATTQQLVSEVQARSEIPYDELCEQLNREGIVPPEIRAIFSLSDHRAPLRMGNVELTWVERKVETMPWGLSVAFDPNNETDRCSVMFDASRYDPAWVNGFLRRYTHLLDAVSQDPEVVCWPESARYV